MFTAKTPKIFRMTRNKNIVNLLAMLFCTLLIVSTMGNSFGIRNSFAQQELKTPQPSTISQSSWSSNLPSFYNGSTRNLPSFYNGSTRNHNAVFSSSQTFTNSKNLNLNHSFVSNKVVGPDRFRFVTSYWTTSDVSRLIDSGRSAGNVSSNFQSPAVGPFLTQQGTTNWVPNGGSFTGAIPGTGTFFPFPPSNLQLETDAGDGYSTLAVVLQYQGVVDLAGITAALKLPYGFKAEFPLTSDRSSHDIALSNYDGPISPSQEVVLYFPVNVLPNAKVGLSVLGPLALHFLRSDKRSTLDSLDASQENMFAKALSITNTTFPNSTMINDSFDFKRDYSSTFGRFIPYDFINQVIPIVFKTTGREVLDVFQVAQPQPSLGGRLGFSVIPGTAAGAAMVVPVKIEFTNHGDAPLNALVAQFITAQTSFIGLQTASVTSYPLAIQGPSTYYIGPLGPRQTFTTTLDMSSATNCNSQYGMQVLSSYINVVGERQQQVNPVVVTTSGNCQQRIPGAAAPLLSAPLLSAPALSPTKPLPPALIPPPPSNSTSNSTARPPFNAASIP
jgi:hypothetical protein